MIPLIFNLETEISSFQDLIRHLLHDFGFGQSLVEVLAFLISLAVLFFVYWFAYIILRNIIYYASKPVLKKSKNAHAVVFLEKKTHRSLAHFFCGFLLYNLPTIIFDPGESLSHTLQILAVIFIIAMFMIFVTRFLHSLEFLGSRSPKFAEKPLSSYVQIILIVGYLFCVVLIASILLNKNPMTIITAFGAGMAIILLIFKNLILGLVASVQVSVNDMVRVGDWISVHNFNADGEVAEINLTSVKVRNWDYTMANVPTYVLVTNGFRNVREMQDMGFRRLMHHLLIDMRSIKEVDDAFVENLRKKGLFEGSVDAIKWTSEKEKDYDFDQVTTTTNLSLFRRYMEAYLEKHPGIDNIYLVVRQLQTDGNGLPLEIYGFVKSVSFKPLNYVQSDVFEHLYTVMKTFELDLYQKPAGEDFKALHHLPEDHHKHT